MAKLERRSALHAILRYKSGSIGLVIVLILLAAALGASILAPADPYVQNTDAKFLPPLGLHGYVWPHLLGTDILGRDVLSRLLYGARLSLLIGFIAVLIGAVIGTPLGMIAGYYGRGIDSMIMRVIDLMLAFPSVLLAVCIVAILGPSLPNAMVAIGIVAIPQYARVVRASVIAEKARDYVVADRALGKKEHWILLRAVLPNVLSPLLVLATLSFAGAVLEAAGLSFIGLGAQPPTPEWGALLFEGKAYVYNAPWLLLAPGLAILATVVGFNLCGDALRDALDPRREH